MDDLRLKCAGVGINFAGLDPSTGITASCRGGVPPETSWTTESDFPSGDNPVCVVGTSVTFIASPPSPGTFQSKFKPLRHDWKNTHLPSVETNGAKSAKSPKVNCFKSAPSMLIRQICAVPLLSEVK